MGWSKKLLRSSRIPSTDSGVLSDADNSKSTTMSSYDSDRHGSWGSRSFSDSLQSNGSRDYCSTASSSRSAPGSLHSSPEIERLSHSDLITLPELTQVPWTEADILLTLQGGQLKYCCGNISIECLQRLSYLLQRPLIRIAREAQRLCVMYNKCTKHDIQTACKVILSPTLYTQCNNLASQAIMIYSMSAKSNTNSKSTLSDLSLSVGKHHRWLLEALPAGYIHELAAVYLTAVMGALTEQTLLLALQQDGLNQLVITTDMLEAGIQRSTDLHCIYQPSSHLVSNGCTDSQAVSAAASRPVMCKAVERNLHMTCVSSLSELADIISMSMHQWYPRLARGSHNLKWSGSAIQSLYYYMRCSDCEVVGHGGRQSLISLSCDRPHVTAPPIREWLRICATFTEHRMDTVVDSDDVHQAARILLPGLDCPIRNQGLTDSLAGLVDRHESLSDMQAVLTRTLLSSGNAELIRQASGHITKTDIDRPNNQGLTALMEACSRGDDMTVLTLLRMGASLDLRAHVSHPSCAGWSALCFATANNHYSVAKILLEEGCSVEGGSGTPTQCETPLQIASASGHIEIVTLLLRYNADPYCQTYLSSGLEARNQFNAISLAASHGKRDVLRRLFADTLTLQGSKLLTLREMLLESCDQQQQLSTVSDDKSQVRQRAEQEEEENEYMVIENDYVTIEELRNSEKQKNQLKERLTSCQITSLQNALCEAAEGGHLDLTLEIQATGVSWTLYVWYTTLHTAHIMHKKAIVQSILRDFSSISSRDDMTLFSDHCLPLMFDIFKESKNEMISKQLAVIFTSLYGTQPLPVLKDIRTHPNPLIDSKYVNSPELADVTFIVEQKSFFAHKIILASASQRFKFMLSNFSHVDMPEIEIRDIDFVTFENVMRYVYEGKTTLVTSQHKAARNLLGAAHYFQLDGLKRKCEIFLSKNLSQENCVSVYKVAKMYNCTELLESCEAFYLQNLSSLLCNNSTFKRLLFSNKIHNRELLDRLSNALASRINSKSNPSSRHSSTS